MAALGWLGGRLCPRPTAGSGGGPVETMLLMEAFGAGLVPEPYFPSVVLGGNLVAAAGSEARKQALLPALAAGDLKLAFACVEAQAGYDLFDVETTAERRGGGYVVNGAKGVVLGGSDRRQDHRLRPHRRRVPRPGTASACSSWTAPRTVCGCAATLRGRAARGRRSRSGTWWWRKTQCSATREMPGR